MSTIAPPDAVVFLVTNCLAAGLAVTPAVVAALAVRRGWRVGLGAVLALGLAAGGLTAAAAGNPASASTAFGLAAALGVGGTGLALWHYGRQQTPVGRLFVGLAAIFFLSTIGVYLAMQLSAGRSLGDIGEGWRRQIGASFDEYLAMFSQQAGGERLGDINALAAGKAAVVGAIFRLVPSILVLGIVSLVLVNVLLTRRLLPAFASLELNRWRAPDAAIWLVLVPALGMLPYLLLQTMKQDLTAATPVFFTSLNLVLIALAPFVIQGLAVMSFFMKRWRFPRFLRGLAYFLMLSQGLLAVAPALGLVEFWTDWRGRAAARRDDEDESANE
jgi:hypothetical protein